MVAVATEEVDARAVKRFRAACARTLYFSAAVAAITFVVMAASSASDAPIYSLDRRLHLSISADQFLPARLRVHAGDIDFLFGEAQMLEILTLLQQEVPPRLAPLLAQRTPSRETTEKIIGSTLGAILTFQPTSSSLWLLGSAEADGRTRTAVPYTLLVDVEPL